MTRTSLSVLAVDGGGIRGIIPARVLEAIEEETGRPIAELFDLVAGTSTGGIIALGLTKPGTGGGPAFSARELLNMYVEHGGEIFGKSALRSVTTLWGLVGDRYSDRPLERLLRERFGTTMLADAMTEVVIPAYDVSRPGPFFFKRRYARETTEDWNVEMWRAGRATSAAPTYFEPAELPPFKGEHDSHALIDGGVFANNPAACAYAEALKLHATAGGPPIEIQLVSVGTGALPPRQGGPDGPVPYRQARGWGLARWARPMLHVVFDGVSKTVDYQMDLLCSKRYHRLQSDLPTASAIMDDASPGNIALLVADAQELVRAQAPDITRVCEVLERIAAERDADPANAP